MFPKRKLKKIPRFSLHFVILNFIRFFSTSFFSMRFSIKFDWTCCKLKLKLYYQKLDFFYHSLIFLFLKNIMQISRKVSFILSSEIENRNLILILFRFTPKICKFFLFTTFFILMRKAKNLFSNLHFIRNENLLH